MALMTTVSVLSVLSVLSVSHAQICDVLLYENFEDGTDKTTLNSKKWKGNDRLRQGATTATYAKDPLKQRGLSMKMNRCVYEGEAFTIATVDCTLLNPCVISMRVLQSTGLDSAFAGMCQDFAGHHTWTTSYLHSKNGKSQYRGVHPEGEVMAKVKTWQYVCFNWPTKGAHDFDMSGVSGTKKNMKLDTEHGNHMSHMMFQGHNGGGGNAACTANYYDDLLVVRGINGDKVGAKGLYQGTCKALETLKPKGLGRINGKCADCSINKNSILEGTVTSGKFLPGWGNNNAKVSVGTFFGRAGAVMVGDAGSFSDIFQNMKTVKGAKYSVRADVWATPIHNTANKAACSTADSNGMVIIRDGHTKQQTGYGTSHCGGSAGKTDGAHCHGDVRLCPKTAAKWVTVKSTFIAKSTETAIALHSESAWAAYFDNVQVCLDKSVPPPPPCAKDNSCVIDCVGAWGKWSTCSKTCGGGMQAADYGISVKKNCDNKSNCGKKCETTNGDTKFQKCNSNACPPPPAPASACKKWSPCFNGGVCSDGGSTTAYTCACKTGWKGKTCSTDVDDCANSPCKNSGNCQDAGNQEFKCTCAPGWKGKTCSEDADDCDPNPCQNGGVCADKGTRYFKCACFGAWTGQYCDIVGAAAPGAADANLQASGDDSSGSSGTIIAVVAVGGLAVAGIVFHSMQGKKASANRYGDKEFSSEGAEMDEEEERLSGV